MIEIDNVTKTYGSGDAAFQALSGVTFTIEEGEFVAIMGPSGSGKSTTMHILGCLDTPTTGTYRLKGKDVSRMTDEELARVRGEEIGFVFQSFNLLPRTSVERNVMLPLIYNEQMPVEERLVRVRAAVRAAGLDEALLPRKSNQLSGGQIQRVAIARALVNDPALILADEPTGNLDSKTGELVLGTFQRLNEESGRTILVITHEPEVAEHAARIITVRDGRIISDAKTQNRRRAQIHD